MSVIRKTFLANLLLVVGLNLLVKPLYVLVVEAHVQDTVGPEEFGLYFALINLSFIFNIIPDVGITNWNNRLIARWGFVPTTRLHQLLGIRLMLGFLYVALCLSIALMLHYSSREVYLLLILALNQVLATGIQFLRSFLSGLHHFRADSVLSVLDRALLIVLMGILLLLNGDAFLLEYLVYGQTAAYGISLAVGLILVSKKTTLQPAPTPVVLINVIRESAPFALLILLSMLANRQDGILIERLHSSHEAGIYAMAYRLGDVLNMFSFLFAGLLLPMFTRLLEEHKSIVPLFEQSSKLLLTGAWTATLITAFSPEFVLSLIYDHHIDAASAILPWVMLSAFLFSLQYITGTLITASGHMRTLILLAGSGMIYNLVLNLFYVPEQGALGAAKASCFMQVIVWIGQIIHVQHSFGALNRKHILSSVVFVLTTTSAAMLLRYAPLSHVGQIGITLLVCLLAAFGLNMIQLSDLRMLLQQRVSTPDHTSEKR